MPRQPEEKPGRCYPQAAKFIQSLGFTARPAPLQGSHIPDTCRYDKAHRGPLTRRWFGTRVKPVTATPAFGQIGSSCCRQAGWGQLPHLSETMASISMDKSFIYTNRLLFCHRLVVHRLLQGQSGTGPHARADEAAADQAKALGHDVGDIDGILGGGTRVHPAGAGTPRHAADGWATPELLSKL